MNIQAQDYVYISYTWKIHSFATFRKRRETISSAASEKVGGKID